MREVSLEKYIKTKRREREEETRKKMQEASRKMDALAKKLGKWDPRRRSANFVTLTSKETRDDRTSPSVDGPFWL